jgi:endoglucanase
MWEDLSSELSKYPESMVAYEILNEAVTEDPENWNKLIERTINTIREGEPTRKIIVGSNMWQSVRTFDDLRVPAGDTNLILSFHFYEPFVLTHYRTPWTSLYPYKGPVKYPGQLIDTADLKQYGDDVYNEFMNYDLHFTKDSIDSLLQKPLNFARRHNLPLYCGEWGCFKAVDKKYMLEWYEDVKQTFDKYNIPWTNWDYKGDFGIVSNDGEVYMDLLDVLLPETQERADISE